MTEKDGEIFQERKKETKKTRILLGKKRRPEVSCKTNISQEGLDKGNIFKIKRTKTYQKKLDKVKRRKKGTVLNITKM